MVARFRARWLELLGESNDAVTLLLSGGGDSTALFFLLKKAGVRFNCLYFQHDSDGNFSQHSADFCRGLCGQHEVSLEVVPADAKALQAQGDLSWEAAARELRYTHLRSLDGVFATAHTADDQAETVMMRMLDGAGLAGLSGIRPRRRDGLIRPLLDFRRQELRDWLTRCGQDWMEDPTNLDGNDRARLRRGLMASLLDERPSLVETLCRTARSLATDEEALSEQAQAWLKDHDQGDHWPLEPLRSLPPAVSYRVFREIWRRLSSGGRRPLGGVFRECERLLRQGRDNRSVHFPGVGKLRRLGATLWLEPYPMEPAFWSHQLPQDWPPVWRRDELLIVAPGGPFLQGGRLIQEGWLRFPLAAGVFAKGKQFVLRSRRPGDRFRGKSVKKILASLQQPPWARDRWPLLLEGSEIVDVPGTRATKGIALEAHQGGWLFFRPRRWRPSLPVDSEKNEVF